LILQRLRNLEQDTQYLNVQNRILMNTSPKNNSNSYLYNINMPIIVNDKKSELYIL
jgi:hypothetical protein